MAPTYAMVAARQHLKDHPEAQSLKGDGKGKGKVSGDAKLKLGKTFAEIQLKHRIVELARLKK